ncbi:hypothetical protein ACMATS_05300 [Streptoverticillium reticulum]|uniref:hypothetical protein n=1 Tax=Streptoverticillium reticulum TaxID=1433415 RepID=UPI0039BEF77D
MQTLVDPVIEQGRCIATRYEKAATIYPAGRHIAGAFLCRPVIQTQVRREICETSTLGEQQKRPLTWDF